jgi:hypothetical protein
MESPEKPERFRAAGVVARTVRYRTVGTRGGNGWVQARAARGDSYPECVQRAARRFCRFHYRVRSFSRCRMSAGRPLTIRPSRRRFAARLNSGVRPLRRVHAPSVWSAVFAGALASSSVTAAPNTIPREFQGEWREDRANCGKERDESYLEIRPKAVSYYESSGPVQAAVVVESWSLS